MYNKRILILGNSITRHSPKPDIGWTDYFGMAASSIENDFVHILLRQFYNRTGCQPMARIRNIADFERQFIDYDIENSLKEEIAFQPDVIIFAIGENVAQFEDDENRDNFKIRLRDLFKTFKKTDDTIMLVRSCFWADKIKDEILQQACIEVGGIFIDISHLGNDESNYARSERSYEHAGVAAHPGDKGMRAIADAITNAYFTTQKLIIHPAPGEELPATDFAITVNDHAVFTHQARVSAFPFNQVWPGYQRPKDQTEIASFASWDMAEPVQVVINSADAVKTVQVRPQSAKINPVINGNTITLAINKPGQYVVEVNGSHKALHLFANPMEVNIPDPTDQNIIYFGPGVHCPGLMTITSNQTVYICGGAVVYGAIFAEHANNIKIAGRGILDGSKFDRMQLNGLISTYDCQNLIIDGITLRDPSGWTVVPIASSHVTISNVKIIGNWRYNTDGIDFVNCRHCVVEDSFIRSYDDSICLKGYDNWGPFIYKLMLYQNQFDAYFTFDGIYRQSFADLQQQYGIYPCNATPIHDYQVRRCVLWNDWGRAMEIGLETVATHISDIHFTDCDIIHTADVAMDVQNGDLAHCHDISFTDIRVELDDCQRPQYQQNPEQQYQQLTENHLPALITLHVIQGYCNYSDERGRINDIKFEDIKVIAPSIPPSNLIGFDSTHKVEKIYIKNLQINGQKATTLESAGIRMNEFVRDVLIE